MCATTCAMWTRPSTAYGVATAAIASRVAGYACTRGRVTNDNNQSTSVGEPTSPWCAHARTTRTHTRPHERTHAPHTHARHVHIHERTNAYTTSPLGRLSVRWTRLWAQVKSSFQLPRSPFLLFFCASFGRRRVVEHDLGGCRLLVGCCCCCCCCCCCRCCCCC